MFHNFFIHTIRSNAFCDNLNQLKLNHCNKTRFRIEETNFQTVFELMFELRLQLVLRMGLELVFVLGDPKYDTMSWFLSCSSTIVNGHHKR